MSKIDYVTRESGLPRLFTAESEWDFLETEEILQEYPYILDSMKREKYYLENELCSFFDEILFENKVVGFATFQMRNLETLLLTECFILPEFRGKRLFFDEICKMYFVGPEFGILQPTRNVVQLLLDYAFAKNFNEDIVVSAIEFHFDDYDAKSTKNRELDEDEMEPSNFYDLSITSTVFVDGDEVIYHGLLENDLRKGNERKKLDDVYFTNLKKLFSDNADEMNQLAIELKDELPQFQLGFDEYVGRGEGLSELMQNMVDENLITFKEAHSIKDQLTREYDSGELTDDMVEQRLLSLLAIDEPSFENMGEFRQLLDSDEMAGSDMSVITDFIDLIGDNDELGNDILKALIAGDESAFQNTITKAMANDDEFMNNFLDLANHYGGESEDEYYMDEFEDNCYKLDNTEYGKDYPVSYDRQMYHLLDSLNMGADYFMAMNFIESEISSYEMLTQLMLQSGLIKTEGKKIDWINRGDSFKKDDLKEILRENNLKISGSKPELLKRLADNNVAYGETFKITDEGKKYLKEFSWIEFYEEFLYDFDFDDFYKYKDNHEGKLIDLSLNYLNEHIDLARRIDDVEYLENCVLTKKIISDEGNKFLSDLNIPG